LFHYISISFFHCFTICRLYTSFVSVILGGSNISAYIIEPVDFNFDFATTGLAAGNVARVGQDAAYKWSSESQTGTQAFAMPSEGFAEVAGLEIFPGLVYGRFEHADYVKLFIGGQSYDHQMNNEMTAPGLSPGLPDPLGASGLRLNGMPINFGVPMLMGGNPMDACPKVPPSKTLEVEIACPPATEGGLALASPWTIRVWLVKVLGVEKVKELLKFQSKNSGYNYYDGNQINCGFDLGDLEVSETMPIRSALTGNPIKNMVPDTNRAFEPVGDWGKLPGGMEQDRPKVSVYSVFSKQMKITTANEWYQFVMSSQNVNDSWGELYWDYDKKNALKITHIGFKNPAVGTIKQLRLKRSGRTIEPVYDVQWGKNPFPMPRLRDPTQPQYFGPSKLFKPFLVWNETGEINMKDNGTAVYPWSSTYNDACGVFVRGIKYELPEAI
jgi:hypothetical protein